MAKKKIALDKQDLTAEEPTLSGLSKEDEQNLANKLKGYLDDLSAYKAKEKTRLDDAQGIYANNIWDRAGGMGKKFNGDKLSLAIPKATVDLMIGSITQYPFEMSVEADSLVGFPTDSAYVQAVAPFAAQLSLKDEDQGRIASELLTHALGTIREQTGLDSKVRHLVENALVDGTCYLKDGFRLSARDNITTEMTVDLVRMKDIWRDGEALTFDSATWLCEMIPTTDKEIMRRFPNYDPKKAKGAGEDIGKTQQATTAKKGGSAKKVLEEWWIEDLSTKEVDGVEVPEFAGGWKRVYRYRGDILSVEPSPYAHGKHPYHELVGVTNPNGPGMSLVLDILASPAYASSKALSMALLNLYLTAVNRTLVNPDALTAEGRSMLKNNVPGVLVPLAAGKTFADAYMPMQGQEVSQSYFAIMDAVDKKLAQVSGAASVPPPGAPEGSTDIVASGLDVGLLRGRVKECLRSVAYNLVMNLVSVVDEDTSFRLAGGLAGGQANFIRFSPAIFREAFTNFEARFTVQVSDDSGLNYDPEQLDSITKAIEAAATLRAADPTIPLSVALQSLPPMPHKNALIKLFYQQEVKAQQENRPDPKQVEAEIQLKTQRGASSVESLKQSMNQLSHSSPQLAILVAAMQVNGSMAIMQKIAQEVATPAEVQAYLPFIKIPELQQAANEWLQLHQPAQPMPQQAQAA